ncbi:MULTISPECIES: pilus (MSHA type) biogenesis protein MshL [unclassified Campylobacter]|uniref:pilus (MSHA type) biogenesis protein MshL n=1 Tax=unclassified Campylobacter TaxID=2593542 RepID=UPI0022E9DB36|nr:MULTISPECIES: pilus (MSHA type) biogenesis protein MshL [unclassified Campylobacter]MDA3055814.1 pilus (MSHA type) biogenesis protein MshL [Campylobacter sp. CN_NA1]MDA3065900.1 pilus (MSHA type) biogenesis protein MshL [Campylobacter sp. CN_NE4]MDA3068670.1 pilus (MSHA type) biogenesis protein MshL [Campylobacter sp. CN_NE3]MDA3082007.1 pilus (MSHA type) biogenesis protein MshL [Campylobacter sp. CN_EL2]MDA3084255.1 pilus (MSHA type) biogenesis protein MshL [Campylobacter sp. CN_NE1]
MSLFHISKKVSIAALLALSVTASSLVAAPATSSDCERKALNIKVNETVTLNEMLSQLSDMCKFSFVAKDAMASEELNKELQGISIKDMSLREVFNLLISENNLDYEYSNGILKVSALDTKTFKVDYITSVREGTAITKSSVDSAPIEVGNDIDDEKLQENMIKTQEKFDFWEKISEEITLILNNGTEKYVAVAPIINQNAGLVTVTGMKSQLKRVEAYLKGMQKRLSRQVLLDVNIVAVELNNDYTTGIDWSRFQLGFSSYIGNPLGVAKDLSTGRLMNADYAWTGYSNGDFGHRGRHTGEKHDSATWTFGAGLNFNIDGMINFLETKGKTKVISSPKVTTMNNQPAIISVGDNINYRVLKESTNNNTISGQTSITYTQYSTFIGILLNILPEISDENKIMLRINPSLSSFKYEDENVRQTGIREIAPDTLQKKISSVVWVNNGDTVILGGLIGQTKTKDNTSVPMLSSIPLVGNLFKSTHDKLSTTELIFVVTPRIIDDTSVPLSKSLKELGYSKSIYENE